MKQILSCVTAGLLALTLSSGPAQAMGQRALVFENATEASIWDHSSEFYLRLNLAEIDGLTNQNFIWAGFHQESPGVFRGEVVVDDYAPTERRLPARARVLHATAKARYFLIEVLDPKGEVLKEFFLKGPGLVETPDLPVR